MDHLESAVSTARRRVLIEGIAPCIDGGDYPVKRVVGSRLTVQTDLVADGHDVLAGAVRHRKPGDPKWREAPLAPLVNDRWAGSFSLAELGVYEYQIVAWVDAFATWRRGLEKKAAAGVELDVDLLIGAALVDAAAKRATGDDARLLARAAKALADRSTSTAQRAQDALAAGLAITLARWPDRAHASESRVLRVEVDRQRAAFSAWYEMFPRSCGAAGHHGSFRDAAERLPYIASMGFDVLYLPPIHPIGRTNRKGKNNSLNCGPDDVGSPWAIGAAEGGHTAIHPELGTLDDFRQFRAAAERHGLELALDIAFQCTPDHPWVKNHPSWFIQRPDGSIQYAENPPKKYQDIYPLSFDSDDWRGLWTALRDVFKYWCEQGIRIFRVDNPHTKSLRFWAWCIPEIKRDYPETIFLAEAFTRPKLMYALAKLGFNQSYTYFTWRETKHELTEYLTELTSPPVSEFFRPNFWPNTPDILPEHLQSGRRGAFIARLVLASTLSSSYGVYGPAYELMEHVPRPGSGEYLDNEKYELKDWHIHRRDSLRPVMSRINRIRRAHPALHTNDFLRFHATDNDQIICYSKRTESRDDVVLVVVNLDQHHSQAGFIHLDLAELGIASDARFVVHDLVTDARFTWQGARSYVEIDAWAMPAHIFAVIAKP